MGDTARERFLASLGGPRRAEFQKLANWEKRLDDVLDEPAQTLDAGWLSREEFAAEIAARLDRDTETVESFWDHLRPADLYLACACARGLSAAIEKFEQTFGGEIGRTARRFERRGLAADDLQQLLRNKLFAAQPGEAPRIASYTGQGFLQNWVRVTTTRAFIDATRPQADTPEIPIADELVAMLPEPGADPELELLKRQHVAHFKAAFAEAVGTLEASDRVVLRQHLVERLSIDQIGALYHLHRATAARRVVKAREALLAATRTALAARLGLTQEQLESVLALIASRMDASVERLLR
ncbi:MAG TPA: transcriptional regulator [Polyangia bacterium]|nr:transcriptional regulator [Polyangia bacterium]